MKFEALNVPSLTPEIADSLTKTLTNLPGVQEFVIVVEKRQFHIIFDPEKLPFHILAQAMGSAGCPIQDISAATFNQSAG